MFKIFLIGLILAFTFSSLFTRYYSIAVTNADEEYDFVIVGAGTTGLVIANRLSEIKNLKILVLEAGEEDYPNFLISIPVLVPFTLLWHSINWGYKTVPQKHACQAMEDQKSHWPRGKVVGGTSCLNFMIYTRGNRADFDHWESLGAEGWGFEQVLPYFKKSENFTGSSDGVDEEFHGKSGPLKTTYLESSPLHKVYIDSAKELGWDSHDYNGHRQIGFHHAQVTKDGGTRHNSASAFLWPFIRERGERLHVLTRAAAKKIEMNEKGDAVGVRYVRDGVERVVKARREVVVSAGAIGTPHLLMLSGIGDPQHLESFGIPVVADLPGVGSNLQDHVMTPACFKSPLVTQDWIGGQLLNPFKAAMAFAEYLWSGQGVFASAGGADSHGFFDTKVKNHTRLGERPDLQVIAQANKFPTNWVFRKLYQMLFNYHPQYTDRMKEWSDANGDTSFCDFFLLATALHPQSVGRIRLQSSDYTDHPLIDPNYLSHQHDLHTMVQGFRLFEQMEGTDAFKKLQAKMSLYSPECDSHKHQHTPRASSFYECLIRKFTWTVYHPVGTAKMGGKDDRMAVVDPRLRVYKVGRIRVADASVMPEITSGNTQAPCYMIGEKASDMIKQDHRLHDNN